MSDGSWEDFDTDSFQKWQSGLPSEIAFWTRIIDGTYPNPDWVADMRQRISDQYPFPPCLAPFVNHERTTRILDVGAGPQTLIGHAGAPGPVEIVAIDPLADEYNTLLDRYGFKPRVRTRKGEGERLSELGLGRFDIVFSQNALDHTYDPVRVIREMIAVCDGVLFFAGSANEAVKEQGEGLHQWNFLPVDNGDLVIWQMDGRALSLRSALGDNVQVGASGSDWYRVVIGQSHESEGRFARHPLSAAAGRPEPPALSPEQALLERIAFLEEQIAELRRASMLEKVRLAPQRASRKATLPRIYQRIARKIVQNEQVYKLVKMRPLMRPIEGLIRSLRTKP
jgi:SAM-dependent methyltransferase